MSRLQKRDDGGGSDFNSEITDRRPISSINAPGLSTDVFDEKNAFVVVLNPEGNIISANHFFAHAAGHPVGELKGVRFSFRFLAPEDVHRFETYIHKASDTLIPQRFTVTFLLKDGKRWSVSCSLMSLVGKDWSVESLVLLGMEANGGKV